MNRLRTLRARFTAVGFAVAAITIAVLTVAFNVVLESSAEQEANSRLRSLASTAAAGVRVQGARVLPPETADESIVDRQVWIY